MKAKVVASVFVAALLLSVYLWAVYTTPPAEDVSVGQQIVIVLLMWAAGVGFFALGWVIIRWLWK